MHVFCCLFQGHIVYIANIIKSVYVVNHYDSRRLCYREVAEHVSDETAVINACHSG